MKKRNETIRLWVYSSDSPCIFKLGVKRSHFIIGLVVSIVLVISSFFIVGGAVYNKFSERARRIAEEKQREDILGKAIVRVRSLEDKLRERAQAIDTLLEEVGVSGGSASGDSSSLDEAQKSLDGEGVGGGMEAEAPVISLGGTASVSSVRSSRKTGLLNRIDYQLKQLRFVPIGMPVKGHITSLFGRRRSPFTHRFQFHEGVDIGVDRKSAVVAVGEGIVVSAGYRGNYGRAVVIDHGNGIETLYGHLSKIKVRVGERICRGQEIGWVGSTGRSTGPHLHYEVRVNGRPTNPEPFLKLADFLELIDKQV